MGSFMITNEEIRLSFRSNDFDKPIKWDTKDPVVAGECVSYTVGGIRAKISKVLRQWEVIHQESARCVRY